MRYDWLLLCLLAPVVFAIGALVGRWLGRN